MRRDVLMLLEDVCVAASSIEEYTRGLTEAGYLANKPIRRAVEREFEIITRRLGDPLDERLGDAAVGADVAVPQVLLQHLALALHRAWMASLTCVAVRGRPEPLRLASLILARLRNLRTPSKTKILST